MPLTRSERATVDEGIDLANERAELITGRGRLAVITLGPDFLKLADQPSELILGETATCFERLHLSNERVNWVNWVCLSSR